MTEVRNPLRLGVASGLSTRIVGVMPAEREDLAAYLRSGASEGDVNGERLIAEVEASGLRGRGGAAFPAGIKLRAVAESGGPRFAVANGLEGEPASLKDRWLLRMRPHLVLDGLRRIATAIGAERSFVVASDGEAVHSTAAALAELGEQSIPVELAVLAHSYVAGEETAVVRAIDSGCAKPTNKPPRPFQSGVQGAATLVANVETLANVPFIAREGAAAYRSEGTFASPGTFLMTLSGACSTPGLMEAPFGLTLGDAIEAMGGTSGEPRGFLMGGFFAGLLGPRAAALPLDYDLLHAQRSGLGCGAVVVIGQDDCPVAAAAEVMAFFERENARQCGACVKGTAAMRDVIVDLAHGRATRRQLERLESWSCSLRGRGSCALLDGAAGLAGSLLREFPDTIAEHCARPCPTCSVLVPPSFPARSRFAFDLEDDRWSTAP